MGNATATKRAKVSGEDRKTQDGASDELHHQIALRAYELYETRGCKPGHEVEDWVQAEQEVLSQQLDADFG